MADIQFTQVVSRGCGMDIHKEVVVATVRGEGIQQESREFNTFTSSLTQLRDWLVSLGITHVAMESTGVYWKPIYNVFEGYIQTYGLSMQDTSRMCQATRQTGMTVCGSVNY